MHGARSKPLVDFEGGALPPQTAAKRACAASAARPERTRALRGAPQRGDFARVRRKRYGKPRDHRIRGPSTGRDPRNSRRRRSDLRFSRLRPEKTGRGGCRFRGKLFWGRRGGKAFPGGEKVPGGGGQNNLRGQGAGQDQAKEQAGIEVS